MAHYHLEIREAVIAHKCLSQDVGLLTFSIARVPQETKEKQTPWESLPEQ